LRRALLAVAGLVVVAAVAYFFLLRSSTVAPHLVASQPVAAIGSGEDAVAVAEDGTVLDGWPPPEDGSLPRLPLDSPPKGPRLRGSMLEQVRVLAAAPAGLRPYVEGSYFGESGVDLNLTSGIELRFGSSAGATRKWRSAAAVLANPETTSLDYVDLHVPGHPTVGGSGHTLPPLP
jgi:cell division septal protein FtsQ